MRVFLSSKDSAQLASALIVDNIKTAFLDPTFVSSVGSGLMRIAFIDTNSDISDNPLEDETENDGNNGGDNDEVSVLGLSLGNIVFISMGSISLFVLVSSFYVWRRRRSDDQDGAATRLANASSYNSTTFDNSSRRPTSPYSEMVSGSYRLDRLGEMSIMSNSNMSPVYEQDQEDTDTAAGSIIVSEGGYTTDAGCTEGGDSTCNESESKVSSSQSEPRFLGARPFPGAVNMDMEEISDSDLDTSGEMSPVKMYIGSSKQQLLLLPSGSDPDEEDSQADESLLFSPQQKPADMGSTITSDMQSMSPEFVPISLSESLSPCSP